MYNAGFVVFTIASILLSFDPYQGTHGALWLIGWRFLQAVGGSMLMANSAAILTDAFPAEQRGMAMGINQIMALSGQFIGLVAGGLLAAWILGHSDRFAAVVARRPIVDFTLMAERAAPWMGALPWDNPDRYVKHSPIYFAGNWKTPTLVLAGEHDAQADEFYSALELRKVKSVMVNGAAIIGASVGALVYRVP